MTEKSDVPQTPEAVAYHLMGKIMILEGKSTDRKALLDLYAECYETTQGKRIIS